MGLYKQQRSPFWWMYIPKTKERRSTEVLVKAGSREQTRKNRELAEAIYIDACNDAIRKAHGFTHEDRPFLEHLSYYESYILPAKRGAERERWIVAVLRKGFGGLSLAQITPERVVKWRSERLKDVQTSTVNREVDVLKRVLNTAVPTYLSVSPLKGFGRLRAARGKGSKETVVLSREHQQKLIAAATITTDRRGQSTAPHRRALIVLAVTTLYRMSDVLDVKWTDIHDTWIEARDTKTGARVRVPLSPQAREALKAIPHDPRTIYIFGRYRRPDPNQQRNVIRQMLTRLCRKAGVPYGRGHGITFHSLRHTGATRMVEAGVDLRTVQELGGWVDLRQLSRYTHPTTAAKVAAVAAVDTPCILASDRPQKSRKKA